MSSSKWNVGKVTSWHNAFRNTHSFNQNLANWDISKATQFYNMFEDTNSFNFKLELDVAWEAKNSNAYPGESMFEGTCSLDSNCGKCGMKKTGGVLIVLLRALVQLFQLNQLIPSVRFVKTMVQK